MGLLDWFKALSRGEDAGSSDKPQAGAIKEEGQIEGLDFVAAIEAHRKWKERLADYVQGTSGEKLDPHVICRDDQCALGKWIYAAGSSHSSHLSLFHLLKARHAQFHVAASQVVEQVQEGRRERADSLLAEGDFPRCSREVQTLLSRLYLELKG